MESKVDKLDVDKFAPVPVDLSKQSDAEKNVVKKVHIKLRKKILKIKYLIVLK